MILMVALAHISALAPLFLAYSPRSARPTDSSALTVFDVPPAAVTPERHPTRLPPKTPPPPQQAEADRAVDPVPLPVEALVARIIGPIASEPSPTTIAPSPLPAESDEGCDLTAAVQAALRSDPAAIASTARLPGRSLSIARALMLWDGRWIAPTGLNDPAALDPIKKVIRNQVLAASERCRLIVQTGPRIIVLGTDQAAISMAIGSGEWHWGDLVLDNPLSN